MLYNSAQKRFEIYKTKDIEILKKINAGETIANIADDNDEGEEEEEQTEQINTEEVKTSKEYKIKKSVGNLNLDECKFIETISSREELYKFDMNKVLDSDDEYNNVKRRSRTKGMLAVIRPW